MIITNVFGDNSPHLNAVEEIRFHGLPFDSIAGRDKGGPWRRGKENFSNLCKIMLEDLQMKQAMTTTPAPKVLSNHIFIVHGHDDGMKEAAARLLERLGLKPIILHEQADKGQTLIEKFVAHSDVGYAVVLLSPDDVGYTKDKPSEARPRARQNVILELGFFLAKLGRHNVLALHKDVPNFEMPSDFSGVIYKPFDSHGNWKAALVKELRAAGYDVDANKL
jgi:predicted nucleotide-binding protein